MPGTLVPFPARPVDPATRPTGWRKWLIASRPRTLTMAFTPVLVGAALAWHDGATPRAFAFALTLLCAVLLQVGTNLLNDVTDFEKGNDRADRLGPLRITAAGLATPDEVRRAAALVFGSAAAIGLVLVWLGGPAILAIGLLSLAAGWAYSGGRSPVSYGAWGELFVLTFFGVVAVAGTYWLQAGAWSLATVVPTGLAIGAMAAAVLLLNNYRDLVADTAVGRRTLAALLGAVWARRLYAALMLAPLLLPAWLMYADRTAAAAGLAWLAAPLLVAAVGRMRRAQGPELNRVLARTAFAQLAFGLLLAAGLLL